MNDKNNNNTYSLPRAGISLQPETIDQLKLPCLNAKIRTKISPCLQTMHRETTTTQKFIIEQQQQQLALCYSLGSLCTEQTTLRSVYITLLKGAVSLRRLS